MIFEYDKEFETLKFISSSGMVQAVHLSVADLEKLYFMLWCELSEGISCLAPKQDCDAVKFSLNSERF